MKRAFWLFLTAILPLALRAQTADLSLPVEQLSLKTGRVYKPAVIKNYNPVTGRVVIASGKSLVTVMATELPDDLLAKLKQLVPQLTPEEIKEQQDKEKARKLAREQRAQSLAERRENDAISEAAALRQQQRTQTVVAKDNEAEREARLREEISQIASTAARRKFAYADNSGLNRVTLTSELSMEEPEPVAGWNGRYRVKGSGYFRDYGSQGSFSTRVREFEVLVQTKDKGRPEVTDITLK